MNKWLYVVGIILIFSVIFGLIYGITKIDLTPITEGEVYDKFYFPSDEQFKPGKFMIKIRNGERTDTWYVTEKYYESVKVGDWVTK